MANLSFYAVCPFGLEELLAGEISACGAERIRTARGGVSFSGSAATAMAVCLNSRLASRVLMKVAEASYWDTRDIYENGCRHPLGEVVRSRPDDQGLGQRPALSARIDRLRRAPHQGRHLRPLPRPRGTSSRRRAIQPRRAHRRLPHLRHLHLLSGSCGRSALQARLASHPRRGSPEGKPCGRSSDALGLGSLPNTHRSVLRLGHDRNRSCADGCRHGAWPQPPLRLRKARGL